MSKFNLTFSVDNIADLMRVVDLLRELDVISPRDQSAVPSMAKERCQIGASRPEHQCTLEAGHIGAHWCSKCVTYYRAEEMP